MAIQSDIQIKKVEIYFLPVETRVHLKFGNEVLTSVICARSCITVENNRGDIAKGWGETPLSVQWVWPSPVSYLFRFSQLEKFVLLLSEELNDYPVKEHRYPMFYSHPMQVLLWVLNPMQCSSTRKHRKKKQRYLRASIHIQTDIWI